MEKTILNQLYGSMVKKNLFGLDLETILANLSKDKGYKNYNAKYLTSYIYELANLGLVKISGSKIDNAMNKQEGEVVSVNNKLFVRTAEGENYRIRNNAIVAGDKVSYYIRKFADGSAEVFLSQILSRCASKLIGTIKEENGKYVFVERYKKTGLTIANQKVAKEYLGTIVAFEPFNIPDAKQNMIGNIVKSFGKEDKIKNVLTALAEGKGFNYDLDKNIQNQLKTVPAVENNEDGLEVFNQEFVIKIDPEGSKDADDAFSVKKLADGTYEAYVVIADVAHYVQEGSPIDLRAKSQGFSGYFPGGVIPMLPEELSNGICSLNEGENRRGLGVRMIIDNKGDVKKSEIIHGIFKVQKALTYEEAEDIHNNENAYNFDNYEKTKLAVDLAYEISDLRNQKREERGAYDFVTPNIHAVFDESCTKVLGFKNSSYLTSTTIVENLMLLANEEIAKFCKENNIFVPNRTHEQPAEERLDELKSNLHDAGLEINLNNDIILEIRKALEEAKKINKYDYVANEIIRSFAKARYLTNTEIGHDALALESYLHFTSPIRRYVDLIVHRQVLAFLDHQPLMSQEAIDKICTLANDRENAANELDTDALQYVSTVWAKDNIGTVLKGYISSINEKGISVVVDFAKLTIPFNYLGDFKNKQIDSKKIDGELIVNNRETNIRIGDNVEAKIEKVLEEKSEIYCSLVRKHENIINAKDEVEKNALPKEWGEF